MYWIGNLHNHYVPLYKVLTFPRFSLYSSPSSCQRHLMAPSSMCNIMHTKLYSSQWICKILSLFFLTSEIQWTHPAITTYACFQTLVHMIQKWARYNVIKICEWNTRAPFQKSFWSPGKTKENHLYYKVCRCSGRKYLQKSQKNRRIIYMRLYLHFNIKNQCYYGYDIIKIYLRLHSSSYWRNFRNVSMVMW